MTKRICTCSVVVLVALAAATLIGCRAVSGAKGSTSEDKKTTILRDRDEALSQLYAQIPAARTKVESAAGYGVFSNLGLKIFLASTESGYGVVVDNKTGQQTFMRMAGGGVGFGFGANDFKAVFIFYDPATLNRFVTSGWQFGAEAGAGAAVSSKGAGAGGTATPGRGIEIYRYTKNGFTLQATIAGSKYWRDSGLNQ
jgi:lipid-binding SYLF domain-containing protein